MIPKRISETFQLGQSIWLDNIQRQDILSGELKRLIDEVGIRGETSNPTIFEKAISSSFDYQQEIQELRQQGSTSQEIYDTLTIEDVRMASGVFREIFDSSHCVDGMVSLEVSPALVNDAEGTIRDARRIYDRVGAPNVMIKIPGTKPCMLAVEECLYEGIPVNITLLFSVAAYEAVAWAYIRAMERRLAEHKPVDCVPSVASFFISRIDTHTDQVLEQRKELATVQESALYQSLKGRLGIANARLAYHMFQEIFSSARFQKLADHGAQVQRPLWASTSTKDPTFPDVYYIDTLIGAHTVNTTPLATILAFCDHGTAANTLGEEQLTEAEKLVAQLEGMDIHLEQIVDTVLADGIVKFSQAYEKSIEFIDKVSLPQ